MSKSQTYLTRVPQFNINIYQCRHFNAKCYGWQEEKILLLTETGEIRETSYPKWSGSPNRYCMQQRDTDKLLVTLALFCEKGEEIKIHLNGISECRKCQYLVRSIPFTSLWKACLCYVFLFDVHWFRFWRNRLNFKVCTFCCQLYWPQEAFFP